MLAFRFDPTAHAYTTDAGRVPSITQMLKAAGLIDDTWFTQEACDRGTAVHDLTAAYDLGALDVESCTSPFRDYLLQHVTLTNLVKPEWQHIEVPFVHEQLRFGGRPDRVGRVFGSQSVVEVKSGPPDDWHAVQLALQAILVAPELSLPPELIQRFGFYITPERFRVEHYKDKRDFDRARKVIRECRTSSGR